MRVKVYRINPNLLAVNPELAIAPHETLADFYQGEIDAPIEYRVMSEDELKARRKQLRAQGKDPNLLNSMKKPRPRPKGKQL